MSRYELEDNINEVRGVREWSVIYVDDKGQKSWIADFCDQSYAVMFCDAMNKRQKEIERIREIVFKKYGDAFKKLAEM